MNINLHIERLVLDGIDLPANRQGQLRSAVEAELGRLLRMRGMSRELAQGTARPSLQAGEIQLGHGVEAPELGAQVAQAAYRGIGR